jgi:hypothetical protein
MSAMFVLVMTARWVRILKKVVRLFGCCHGKSTLWAYYGHVDILRAPYYEPVQVLPASNTCTIELVLEVLELEQYFLTTEDILLQKKQFVLLKDVLSH